MGIFLAATKLVYQRDCTPTNRKFEAIRLWKLPPVIYDWQNLVTFSLCRLRRLPNQRWTNWWQATRWRKTRIWKFVQLFAFRLPLALDQPGQMATSNNSSSNKATRRSTLSSEEAAVDWDRTLWGVRFWDKMIVVNLKARHPAAVLSRLKSKIQVRGFYWNKCGGYVPVDWIVRMGTFLAGGMTD